jgi:isopenicillin-N epimerase
VVVAAIPFPIDGPDTVVAAVLGAVTERTRLVLLDHVTSPTGLVLPVAELAAALSARGIDVLVDGAHAPGMVPLDLGALAAGGVSYYTANCHKWLCAPKGAAFLYVRPDRQDSVRPLTISHGANSPRTDRSRWQLEFDWTGTDDPTAVMSLPAAVTFLESVLPGGLPSVLRHNHDLVVEGRSLLAAALGVEAPCPASMLGSLASLALPDAEGNAPVSPLAVDPLQDALWRHDRIEVPIMTWPAPPRRLLRISAQVYNTPEDYQRLATALSALGVAI